MGYLMENGFVRWKWNDDKNKLERKTTLVGLKLTASFKNGLCFHKSITSFDCWGCGETKHKYTRYLCNGYYKVCVDCATKWIEESKKALNEAIGMLEDRKVEMNDENKIKRWNKERVLGAIGGED